MDDKMIMENILQTTKGACDLYMHGTIESGTQNVHDAFSSALNESIAMQSCVYKHTTQKGWYTVSQAQEQQIQQVKQKFSSN